MKVGVMTWFQFDNYGTALQLVALCHVIQVLGHEPIVIKYHTRQSPMVRPKGNWFITGVKFFFKIVKDSYYCPFDPEEKKNKFHQFLINQVKFTDTCDTLPELESLNTYFDVFICGSDQIWTPTCFDTHYFLDFVTDEKKMIAYAPSIGLYHIDDQDIAQCMQNLVKRFRHLSTREESGSNLLSGLIGKPVKTVLDPTLLLCGQQWHDFVENSIESEKEPFLLAYFLGHDENQWKKVYEIGKQLQLRVKVIPIFYQDFRRKGCCEKDIGPNEFLTYFFHASYVCTDSFHGLLFSINFKKNFCVFERFDNSDPINQNSRIHHILKELGLMDRMIQKNGTCVDVLQPIDYSKPYTTLEKMRCQSITFLREALHQVKLCKKTDKKNHIFNGHTLCCGCGVCQIVCPPKAIHIHRNAEGFFSACIDESKCISCGKCRNVCPYIELSIEKNIKGGQLYSYKDFDAQVLLKSSSGGIAYRMARLWIEQGGAVSGCEFDRDTQQARHIVLSNSSKDIECLQGSKYMQSNFSMVVKDILSCEKDIIVFGTPCQIAGIRRLLRKRRNVTYIDLICHGVPSYHLYKRYKDYIGRILHLDTTNMKILFRYKAKGWRERYIYSEISEQFICNHRNKDPYFLMFEYGVCYSKACYECPWRNRSAADIRIGDYWGDKFKRDHTGVSMALAMDEKGNEMMKVLSSFGKLEKEPLQDYLNYQQTKNNLIPPFWVCLIHELSDSNQKLENILHHYVIPYEKRQRIWRKMQKIWQTLKKWKLRFEGKE